ncbi:Hypothetical predicted protein [Mytilus galloprovincialis]|uniref:Uncharacterized protein n=1 Tax=Mytilus galloprovincialis TaxID=29158 RepID=A0A8B6FE59_MYTGA|nr:Hypothetical predicted protein [Mytilus galloprovincialis]
MDLLMTTVTILWRWTISLRDEEMIDAIKRRTREIYRLKTRKASETPQRLVQQDVDETGLGVINNIGKFVTNNINRGLLISALLKENFNDNKMIAFCDNSNLSYKKEPLNKFLDTRDCVQLNESRIRVFASNLRDCIDNILDLLSRHSCNYGNRHPYDGQRD